MKSKHGEYAQHSAILGGVVVKFVPCAGVELVKGATVARMRVEHRLA